MAYIAVPGSLQIVPTTYYADNIIGGVQEKVLFNLWKFQTFLDYAG